MPTSSSPLPLRRALAIVAGLALIVSACGGEESTATNDDTATDEAPAEGGTDDDSSGLPNACPADGCQIFINDAASADGGEIELTFEANFTPDFERNHIHVFWDSQEAGAVSSDFAAQGYSVQGQWHPTDSYPMYVTEADASIDAESRADSTTICVTAADTDHAVLDAGIVACRDVAELLT